MSPALIAHQSAAMLRPARRNRRRYTQARASVRRIVTTTAIAAGVTLAAVASSTLTRWSAERTDAAVARVATWILTGKGPLTVGTLDSLPEHMERDAWKLWSRRLVADHLLKADPDHPSEENLKNASPDVRAAILRRLD